MTYWHMQLHPNNPSWHREEELLEKKGLIGLGFTKQERAYNDFKSMKIGDIVLIKNGANPIALVKVIGDVVELDTNQETLDWFRIRRKVEVIDILREKKHDFPSPRGIIKKSINKYTLTYQYIDYWYKQTQNKREEKGLKLISLTIDDYKIFQHFSMNFTDKDNNPLPIVVIAGKNGTGKTTIFKYLTTIKPNNGYKIKYKLDDKVHNNLGMGITIGNNSGIVDEMTSFLENIIYLPARTPTDEEFQNLEKIILEYIDYFIYEQSLTAVIGYENLQNDIDEIFSGFDLSFQFKKIDFKDKKSLFEPYDSSRDDIEFKLEKLSTGEKTLLFKILNLYLQQARNKLILIDEPELSLHPSWQNRVLQVYEKFAKINNNQIIIATHSPYIIGSSNAEYLRILRKKSDGSVEALDNFSKSYGLEFDKILLEIMDMDGLRTPDVEKNFKFIKENIYSNSFENNDEFMKTWNNLEDKLGSDDLNLKLLKLEMNMRVQKNVSNNEK